MAGWLDQEGAYTTWVEVGGGEKGARGGRLAGPGGSLLYLGRGGRRGEGSQGWQVGWTRRKHAYPPTTRYGRPELDVFNLEKNDKDLNCVNFFSWVWYRFLE